MENTTICFEGLNPKYLFEMRSRPKILGFCEIPSENCTTVSILSDDKESAAECITDFILKAGSIRISGRHLDKAYSFLSGDEKSSILKSIEKRPPGKEVYESVFGMVYDYLKNHDTLNLDGFIKFRLKHFSDITANIAGLAAEDIISKSRYDDAVQFLKYFVTNSAASHETLNVVFSEDGDFVITDIHENPVFVDDLLIPGADKQDAMLGIFIDLLPKKIIVHNEGFVDSELKSLLYYIFNKRVFICPGCSLCKDEE